MQQFPVQCANFQVQAASTSYTTWCSAGTNSPTYQSHIQREESSASNGGELGVSSSPYAVSAHEGSGQGHFPRAETGQLGLLAAGCGLHSPM